MLSAAGGLSFVMLSAAGALSFVMLSEVETSLGRAQVDSGAFPERFLGSARNDKAREPWMTQERGTGLGGQAALRGSGLAAAEVMVHLPVLQRLIVDALALDGPVD